ncbi:MFS transporter [Paraburkholderia phymatum]|uniref:MFS transporter n=1 Tax=Paraburkholderia phymatum TaxID=148447 RepID=UPI00317CE497
MTHLAGNNRSVDLQDFLDGQRFSPLHWITLILCFLIMAIDGFDTGSIGYIAPSLVQEWKIPRESLGPVLSASLFGLGIGALVAGPIADRIGRKVVLVGSVVFFGIWSLASAHAGSIESLALFRFLTGLGLGASAPNAGTLVAEYAPARVRSLAVNATQMGFVTGLSLGGVISNELLPQFGWQGVLVTGGILPLVLSVALILLLPESLKFLVIRQRPRAQTSKILKRMNLRDSSGNYDFAVKKEPALNTGAANPVLQLFSRNYYVGTFLLWVGYFMCLAVFYLLTSWLPVLFKTSGFTLQQSILTSSLFHLGGMLGVVVAGWFMDRFRAARVVTALFVLTAFLIIGLGQSLGHPALLIVMILITGAALSGSVGSMVAVAASFYPTTSRATGVAWMYSVGRLGAIGGAFGGGILLANGWKLGGIFTVLSVPLAVTAICVLILSSHRKMSSSQRAADSADPFTA